MKNNLSLMERLILEGYPAEEMDHHNSDLYVYVTPLTTKVVKEYCEENGFNMSWHCPTFKDNITGKKMYDCAFQYYTMHTMRRQFLEEKSKNKDYILLFKLGDFYEIFYEDAQIVSSEINIALTERTLYHDRRNPSSSHHVPLCGIPVGSVGDFEEKLSEKGYKTKIILQKETQ